MTTHRTLPERIERGGEVVRALLAWLFRLTVLALFLPAAWSEAGRGNLLAAVAIVAFACTIGALLAPTD